MATVKADFVEISTYASSEAAGAVQVASAAAADSITALAAAVPVFGLIGQDFLLAFAGAQASFMSSSAEIAAVKGSTAITAASAVSLFEGNELVSAASFLGNL